MKRNPREDSRVRTIQMATVAGDALQTAHDQKKCPQDHFSIMKQYRASAGALGLNRRESAKVANRARALTRRLTGI